MRLAPLPAFALIGLWIATSACSSESDTPAEAKSAATSRITSDDVCTIAAATTAAATGAAVTLSYSTAACSAGALVTLAGEVVCLIPAGGAGATWITALAAGAAMWLACETTSGTITQRVTAAAPSTTTTGTPSSTSTSMCNPADLADGCDCAEVDRRYSLQKQLCAEGGSCNFSLECEDVERIMAVTRNCINARRDVQLCYRVPDFDGHQTAINEQCSRFRNCDSVAQSCEAYSTFPQLPSPCAF
jgi:hypothetical protein